MPIEPPRVFFPVAAAAASTSRRHSKKIPSKEDLTFVVFRSTTRRLSKPIVPPTELYTDCVKLSPPKLLPRFRRGTPKPKISWPIALRPRSHPKAEASEASNRRLSQATDDLDRLLAVSSPATLTEED
ncbi:hypothetical protein PC123_g20665 [Phytophthora cactorum]|nr:hypothetical protein PC123_g20665 [Phytophthora cactorum]